MAQPLRIFQRTLNTALCGSVLLATAACSSRVFTPPAVPAFIPGVADSAGVALARSLAPILYLQRDEPFTLDRVVAIIHPSRPIIAYHLRWSHDVNGQWLPWTKASDAEIAWVGYDSASKAATDIWTYWHGYILHADWRGKGPPAVAVQWGKHGTLPYGTLDSDLPYGHTLETFYALEFALLPDIWLGRASHGGPLGFLHSYERYTDFSKVLPLYNRLDAVVETEDPQPALLAIFGERYANKQHWP